MAHNIFVTGASGYLGGTVLARWKDARLPPNSHLYALVRSEEQGEKVKQYGAQPLVANRGDQEKIAAKIAAKIVDLNITIIHFLVDAYTAEHQHNTIQALGKVRAKTGQVVHFLHTTDTDPGLYDLQKNTKGPLDFLDQSVKTTVHVIDSAEHHGMRSYIFAPCLVYGRGEGFGNKTSIKDVSIVQAAQGARSILTMQNSHVIKDIINAWL